jgi:hypothetical protein
MSTNNKTLKELMQGTKCITGFELNQLVESILSQGDDGSDEYEVAVQLWNDYFSGEEGVYKPAKFAYYTLVHGSTGYGCKRDLNLSPRGVDYFVPDTSAGLEYDPQDTLRTVISNKQRIKGSDLKELTDATLAHEKTEDEEAYTNFSVQLAEYLKQYYLQDGNIRDNIWYFIKTKEYGTLVVLRDQTRSPRTTSKK